MWYSLLDSTSKLFQYIDSITPGPLSVWRVPGLAPNQFLETRRVPQSGLGIVRTLESALQSVSTLLICPGCHTTPYWWLDQWFIELVDWRYYRNNVGTFPVTPENQEPAPQWLQVCLSSELKDSCHSSLQARLMLKLPSQRNLCFCFPFWISLSVDLWSSCHHSSFVMIGRPENPLNIYRKSGPVRSKSFSADLL